MSLLVDVDGVRVLEMLWEMGKQPISRATRSLACDSGLSHDTSKERPKE